MTPYCPIFVAARVAVNVPVFAQTMECMGSRCSWWVADPDPDEHRGSCGLGNGQTYADPARPTTRQTTRKPA